MKDFSVLMLDGEGDISLFVGRCLGQIERVKLHVLSKDKWVPLRFSRHTSTFQHSIKTDDDEQQLVTIKKAIKQTQCDIILPVAEPAIRFVSKNASLMRPTNITPVPAISIFDTVINKWSLIDFLTEHNIACPSTVLYTSEEGFKQKLNKLSFPVLIKPIRGSDGRGIEFFHTLDALLVALEKNGDFVNQYIVQSYIDGYDIDCNVLCQDGRILAHTIQRGFIFRGRRFTPPAGVEFVQNEQALDIVSKWVSATKWNGVAHIDLRYDNRDEQIKIIEVNARYWGSLLGSLVAGVNFPYLACLTGLGILFASPEYNLKKFVSGNAAVKTGIHQLVYKDQTRLSFKETSWKFAVADPLAEAFKLSRQFWQS